MFYDIKITDDLLTVPDTPPRLIRQKGSLNLLALAFLDNYERSGKVLSVNTEINFDEYIFKSIPDFYNLSTNNTPQLKKYNSELKRSTKTPNLKRINTF